MINNNIYLQTILLNMTTKGSLHVHVGFFMISLQKQTGWSGGSQERRSRPRKRRYASPASPLKWPGTSLRKGLQRRQRPAVWLPGAGGEDGKVEADEPGVGDTISSLVLVTPWRWWGGLATYLLNLVEDLRCNSQVNSSLILLQISELNLW